MLLQFPLDFIMYLTHKVHNTSPTPAKFLQGTQYLTHPSEISQNYITKYT